MPNQQSILRSLGNGIIGYYENADAATEPTALAAMLFLGGGQPHLAEPALNWLLARQQTDGALGVTADAQHPRWPTSLGLLCFQRARECGLDNPQLKRASDAAIAWILGHQGEPIDMESKNRVFGHDTTLIAWPWVMGTHSWIEPTCLHLIALRAAGYGEHPRAQSAEKLLANRILPEGGCNYGNTFVLGQQLRAHLQPSGMLAVALSDTPLQESQPLKRTVEYLRSEASRTRAAISLAWAELGVVAQRGAHRADRLQAAAQRALDRRSSPYRRALLGLALLGADSPLLPRHTGVVKA